MEINNYIILITLSLIVLASHVFDRISKTLKIPSVLLLLGTGVLLKYLSIYFHLSVYNLERLVPFFGIVGLIFIVLEGSLDLKINKENLPLIKKSFGSAFFILVLSTLSIAMLLTLWLKAGFKACFVNAIPLAVISSAVAIPTVSHLTQAKKEFITYESIFSDIMGIILFNTALSTTATGFGLLTDFISKLILIIMISAALSFLLVVFISKTKAVAKFYLILAGLILAYSLGKLLHMSSLLLVLFFGLLLNNCNIFTANIFHKIIDLSEINNEINKFKLIVIESTFLIRTFFFVLFGYSIDLFGIFNKQTIILGAIIVLILLTIRFLYLRFFIKIHLLPELFIAPRGLVTILLFYSIPAQLMLESFTKAEILFVVVTTSLLMLFALRIAKNMKKIDVEY